MLELLELTWLLPAWSLLFLEKEESEYEQNRAGDDGTWSVSNLDFSLCPKPMPPEHNCWHFLFSLVAYRSMQGKHYIKRNDLHDLLNWPLVTIHNHPKASASTLCMPGRCRAVKLIPWRIQTFKNCIASQHSAVVVWSIIWLASPFISERNRLQAQWMALNKTYVYVGRHFKRWRHILSS